MTAITRLESGQQMPSTLTPWPALPNAPVSVERLHQQRARSGPFRLSLLLQLQDMPSHGVKLLFDDLTEKRVLLIGQS